MEHIPVGPTDLDLSSPVRSVGKHYIAIGDHADLWQGSLSKDSGKASKVAIKVLRGGSTSKQSFFENLNERLHEHGKVWRQFDHPNVAHFYGLAFNCGNMPALVLTFYPNGNIVEYLKQTPDPDKIQEVARGFNPPVVHGDIRGANFLIDDDHDGHAVLADYGLAFIIDSSDFTSIKTAGTCRWTAPEVMNPPEDELELDDPPPMFTMANDIYTFAMTVIEIFTGQLPFSKKKNDSAVTFAVLAGKRPDLTPCLQTENPALREYNIPFDSSLPPPLENLAGSLYRYEPDIRLTTLGGTPSGDDIERGEPHDERDRRQRRPRCIRWGYWTLLLTIFMSLASAMQVFLAWRASYKAG